MYLVKERYRKQLLLPYIEGTVRFPKGKDNIKPHKKNAHYPRPGCKGNQFLSLPFGQAGTVL